jgi:hypothetical protein
MMRISCLVNLVCRHRSSRATGLGCGNADVLFSCSSSSISVASSMIGLSGGVAIARWPPNRSPPLLLQLLLLLLLVPPLSRQLLLRRIVLPHTAGWLLFTLSCRSSHAVCTRTGHPMMVRPGAPVVPARHRPRHGRPVSDRRRRPPPNWVVARFNISMASESPETRRTCNIIILY